VQWENQCSSFSLLSKHRFFTTLRLSVSQTPSAVRPALCSSPIARLFACPFLLQFSVTPEFRSAISIFEFSQLTRILDHLDFANLSPPFGTFKVERCQFAKHLRPRNEVWGPAEGKCSTMSAKRPACSRLTHSCSRLVT